MSDTPPTTEPDAAPSADAPPPTAEQVFHEYAPRIYQIARRLLGNDADAEDVTSEVLLQVVRKLDTFRGEAALSTWLHRVTVNAALALREKRAKQQQREAQTDAENLDALDLTRTHDPYKFPRLWSLPPDLSALATEQREVIEAAIAQLPEPFRDVYVLADVEGLPNAEIANILNLSVSAVKSRLHRARMRMRDLLAPHFEEVLR
jgi:RNA polymerase sigma-70 factor (ECF subfamily)